MDENEGKLKLACMGSKGMCEFLKYCHLNGQN